MRFFAHQSIQGNNVFQSHISSFEVAYLGEGKPKAEYLPCSADPTNAMIRIFKSGRSISVVRELPSEGRVRFRRPHHYHNDQDENLSFRLTAFQVGCFSSSFSDLSLGIKDISASEPKLHHLVFCWLKDSGNREHRNRIMQACEKFRKIPGVLELRLERWFQVIDP